MMKTETRKFGGKHFHNQTTTLASLDDNRACTKACEMLWDLCN